MFFFVFFKHSVNNRLLFVVFNVSKSADVAGKRLLVFAELSRSGGPRWAVEGGRGGERVAKGRKEGRSRCRDAGRSQRLTANNGHSMNPFNLRPRV